MNKRLTFISDTHFKHALISPDSLGSGDIILHAGDFTRSGNPFEIFQFLEWFSGLDYTYKVFIAGNHELGFEKETPAILSLYQDENVIYLQDQEIILEGLKIYGSPWQPEFGGWEFNLPRGGKELEEKWNNIPEDVDILLTHSPVYGYLDLNREGMHCGCEVLYRRVNEIEPWIHVWGHIHEARGQKSIGNRELINASVMNRAYEVVNNPIRMEVNLSERTVKYL